MYDLLLRFATNGNHKWKNRLEVSRARIALQPETDMRCTQYFQFISYQMARTYSRIDSDFDLYAPRIGNHL